MINDEFISDRLDGLYNEPLNNGNMKKCIKGVNQTHTMNHVTNGKCELLPEKVAAIKALPADRLETMRFIGGSVSGAYLFGMFGHNAAEAKASKWQRNRVDPIEPFIELTCQIGWGVLIVLNGEDLFQNYLKGSLSFEASLTQQMSMVDRFVRSGVRITGVEIGNELQIYTGVKGEYNRNKGAYDTAIRQMFEMTEATNKRIKSYYPNMLTGSCYVSVHSANANGRDRRWQSVFAKTSCDALIVHHYEESPNEDVWVPILKQSADYIRSLGRLSWFTESMFNFGPGKGSPKYAAALRSTGWQKYKELWPDMVDEAGFDIACYHRLSGNEGHPYDLIQL